MISREQLELAEKMRALAQQADLEAEKGYVHPATGDRFKTWELLWRFHVRNFTQFARFVPRGGKTYGLDPKEAEKVGRIRQDDIRGVVNWLLDNRRDEVEALHSRQVDEAIRRGKDVPTLRQSAKSKESIKDRGLARFHKAKKVVPDAIWNQRLRPHDWGREDPFLKLAREFVSTPTTTYTPPAPPTLPQTPPTILVGTPTKTVKSRKPKPVQKPVKTRKKSKVEQKKPKAAPRKQKPRVKAQKPTRGKWDDLPGLVASLDTPSPDASVERWEWKTATDSTGASHSLLQAADVTERFAFPPELAHLQGKRGFWQVPEMQDYVLAWYASMGGVPSTVNQNRAKKCGIWGGVEQVIKVAKLTFPSEVTQVATYLFIRERGFE